MLPVALGELALIKKLAEATVKKAKININVMYARSFFTFPFLPCYRMRARFRFLSLTILLRSEPI
jgi:hypothetical protein